MDAKVCPGCHFGCAIDGFQCGRGEKLHARWVETGELPERRRPPHPGGQPGGRDGGRPAIPVDDRIMHMLHIIGIALSDLADESGASAPERRAIDCLMRHGGSASERIVEGRTHAEGLDALFGELVERGLVKRRGFEHATLYALTEQGLAQAKAWESERKATEAEFLGVLDDGEKEQLLALVMKLLEPGFKRRGMRND